MKEELLLIDASSYIFRAYYGVRANLTNKAGDPTNAVFGFKNMVTRLLKSENPTHCVMVLDPKGPSFRKDLYPEYKANRGETPEDLKIQFEPIMRLIDTLNLPKIVMDGFEADDLIGSLVHKFKDQITVKIISGDKDLAQLISRDVYMLDTMKDFLYTPAEVEDKFGVLPEKIVEYLALMGDTSDNIPGAQGIGPKTAAKLLNTFGSIKNLYENADQLKGKQKEKIIASKENVEISLKLTQIKCDIEINNKLDDFLVKDADADLVRDFYDEMNFKPDPFLLNLTGKETEEKIQVETLDRDSYKLVTDETELGKLVNSLQEAKTFAFDLETTDLRAVDAKIVGVSFAWDGGTPVYIPTGHTEESAQIETDQMLKILAPLFESEDLTLVGQNIKYELMVLANYGIEVKGQIEDTMLESYLLNAETNRHNLDDLAKIHLNHKMISYKEVVGTGKKQIGFAEVPLEKALLYAAEDSDATWRIHKILSPILKEKNLENLYRDIELPLVKVLAKIERNGVKIDQDYMQSLSDEFTLELEKLIGKIYQEAGMEFNINSPKQLQEILFEKLEIPTTGLKKTKSGFSTDASVLEKLKNIHPIAEYLLEYRAKNKLINTYLDVLPELVSKNTGRIHTSYNQTVTATGRLSSNNPNLQNIPVKGEDGNKVRAAFVADRGNVILAADYSQIELRLLAHLSSDENLQAAFNSGADIHSETAAAIFAIPAEEISADQRRAAKAINFGIIYGMGAFKLSQEIGVTNRDAKNFIEAYFNRYPNIKKYMEECVNFARENMFVETIFKRQRALRDIKAKNHILRSATERIAVNSPIQGSAADLIKKAMIEIQKELEDRKLKSKMIMQVHDELVFEVPESELELMKDLVKNMMQDVIKVSVPLTVEAGIGKNWQEAH